MLDANGEGIEGFESGPGIDVSIPLFNRNQGGQLRAQSELQRAHAALVQLQQQVGLDVREASALFDQARQSRLAWGDKIVAPLRGQSLRCRGIIRRRRELLSLRPREHAGG